MPSLDWIGKRAVINHHREVPYRLLKCDKDKSFGDPESGNLLVQGDNLEALKALLPYYAGKVKCIYIDPPYNTGNESWIYNDNVNSPEIKAWLGKVVGKEAEDLSRHDKWLCMMYPRLRLLKEFLREDGSIWISIDDYEVNNLRNIMDEIFGRGNFINQISAKMKLNAGASGGGEDKKLKKNIEYILVYARNYENGFQRFNDVYDEENLFDVIEQMEANDQSWKYTSILKDIGTKVDERIIEDGSGDPIVVKKYKNLERSSVNELLKKGQELEDIYLNHFEFIFSDTNAQTSIRTRIIDEFNSLESDELLIASYVPKSGRSKNEMVNHFYISPSIRRVIWLKDTAEKRNNFLIKKEIAGTLWQKIPLNNLTKEGNVKFPNGKKPEALIEKILNLATVEGDIVLDSFLGSGTTAAVSLKLKRRFIGVEIGDHSTTHCVPRLSSVVQGDDTGGISESVDWKGGGGFRYCTLGGPLFDADGNIADAVSFSDLAAHVFFCETGAPIPKRAVSTSTLIGIFQDRAIHLLYAKDSIGVPSTKLGNVLDSKMLEALPKAKDGITHRIVYAEGCTLSESRLAKEGVIFKHIPYQIAGV